MTLFDKLPKPFFILAPMDDVTDTVFRQIVAQCAKPDLFFTEFVNVDGLASPGRDKLLHKLWLSEAEKPVIAQLWGLKPDNYYHATKDLKQMGFAGVDINMGCPVRTVIKNGACSALINNRPLATEIVQAVQAAAGENFPVSVKTRVGFNEVDLTWLEHILGLKVNMLTIHGRTAKQLSKVPASWDLIGQVVKLRDAISPDTLMVGNGDVASRTEAASLADTYGLDAVMIGRGVFNDPYVFAEDSRWTEMPPATKLTLFERHIMLHQQTYRSAHRRFETLRKFCKVYVNGFDGASAVREQFMQTTSAAEALDLLDKINLADYQARAVRA